MAHAWSRRPKESIEAHAAFSLYLEHGSIDAAYAAHLATKGQQKGDGKRAPRRWATWSADNEWVARAAAYADHLAEQNRQLWEQRRRDLQERDWAQADALRDVAEQGIKDARLFTKRHVQTINGETVITLTFDIVALSKVLTDASKLQRLATDQPTENINNLSGAALDAYATSLLAHIIDGGQTRGGDALAADDDGDDSRDGGDAEMPE